MATTDESDQRALRLEAYQLSRVRIFEQVLINALSALAIGVVGLLISLLLLTVQSIAHFVVVPTNLLMAIVFFGVGALIMLLIVVLTVFTTLRKAILNSNAFAFAVMFGLLGYAIGSKLDLGALMKSVQKEPNNQATQGEDATPKKPASASSLGASTSPDIHQMIWDATHPHKD